MKIDAEGWWRRHLWWNEYLWKRMSSVWIFWCDCCWQSIPLSLCAIISGCPRHPCKTQHRLLLPNSLTHAPSVFFQDQRMESISHLLQNSRRCMQLQIWIKMRFPVANILSLKTCNSTSSLCCPEFCALPLSLLLSIFIHVTSFVSGPMLPALCLKTQGRSPFHTPVDPVQLLLNTSLQALILKHRIPIHKIIVIMMLLR